jgi:hypothetical protein
VESGELPSIGVAGELPTQRTARTKAPVGKCMELFRKPRAGLQSSWKDVAGSSMRASVGFARGLNVAEEGMGATEEWGPCLTGDLEQ